MARPSKSKGKAKKVGNLSSSALRQASRLAAEHGDLIHGRPRKAKKVEAAKATATGPSKAERKTVKLVDRALAQSEKRDYGRALGHAVEALAVVDSSVEALDSLLPDILVWSEEERISNAQGKALAKARGWQQVPWVRLVGLTLLARAGRGKAVETLIDEISWTDEERPHAEALAGESAVEDPYAVEPWGALEALLDGEALSHATFASSLMRCVVSRLDLEPADRRALIIGALEAGASAPIGVRVAALAWARRELGDEDELATELAAALGEQIDELRDGDPDAVAELALVLRDELSGAVAVEVQSLRAQALLASQSPLTAPAYSMLAETLAELGKSTLERRLAALRTTVSSGETFGEKGLARLALHQIERLGVMSEDERRRLAILESEGDSDVDRAVRELEAAAEARPEDASAWIELATASFERRRKSKSEGDRLRAINALATAVEVDPAGVAVYSVVRRSLDHFDAGQSAAHKRLLTALEGAAAGSMSAATWRGILGGSLAGKKEEMATWARRALESEGGKTAQAYLDLVEASSFTRDEDLQRQVVAQAKADLNEKEGATVELHGLTSRTREDTEFEGESDPRFAAIEAALGWEAWRSMAKAYMERRGRSGYAKALELFNRAIELEPKNRMLSMEAIAAAADPARGEEGFHEAVAPVLTAFPDLQRYVELMGDLTFRGEDFSARERQEMSFALRQESLLQHFRAMHETEAAKVQDEADAGDDEGASAGDDSSEADADAASDEGEAS